MQPVPQISDRVSEQLLTICCRNTARSAIPLMLLILFTYFLLHGKIESVLLQTWALLSCTVVLSRVVLLRAIGKSDTLSHLAKRMWATALTLVLGVCIASVLLFFNSVGLFERSMLTAIMLGLCSASYSINIGYPPLLLTIIGPPLGTLSLLWALNSGQDVNTLFAFAVSASIVVLFLTLVRNGKFMFEVFSLAIESQTKLEEQSQRLSDALHHAEDAKSAAETSSQSKTRFIAAASHDLRQPVHVLNLFSGALRNAPLDERTRDIVDNMNIAVTSLSSQLNSLLDISELDSGSVKPDIKSVDVCKLAQTLMGEMSKLAEDKNLELINDVPAALYVMTDAAMLAQIIRNLCGNAIKYTHQGSVRIQASTFASEVVLSIVDTGIGIELGDSDKVFEEFYQVSNHTRDKAKGLGLGLSIVERLIGILDHELSLDSRVGEGTSVSIKLQRSESVDAPALPDDQFIRDRNSTSLPTGFWVHLVDDETAVQNSVTAFLETFGAKVTISESSAEAIEFLSVNQPDALLVDIRLQDGDSGLAVVDSVDDPTLPIAVVTGESITDGDLAHDYPHLLMLQKPVSDEALLELLDYMVTERGEKRQMSDERLGETTQD